VGNQAQLNNSKKKSAGNRMSKQNYCTNCAYREEVAGKKMCMRYFRHVTDAAELCVLLKPFDLYKAQKQS
jgi:hypothetical protein